MGKKCLAFLLSIIFLLSFASSVSAASERIILRVDFVSVDCDVPPRIVDGRTMIPARALFEDLGAVVSWSEAKKQVTIDYNNRVIVLQVDNDTAKIDGVSKEMDVPAQIIQDRTFIPVRFVAENLGFDVKWDPKSYIVDLLSPKSVPDVKPEVKPEPEPEKPEENKKPEPVEPSVQYDFNLKNVNIEDSTDKTIITLKGVGNADVTTLTLSNPTRLVFDFDKTKLTAEQKEYVCSEALLTGVRLGQFDMQTTRVVFDLSSSAGYSVKKEKKQQDYVITLSYLDTEISVPDDEEDITGGIEFDPDQFVVCIDPGHGGSEVGTIGKYNDLEDGDVITMYEKTSNLKISNRVNELLAKNGVQTYMLRSSDKYINIYDRPKLANDAGADLYLSIHNNASTNTDISGTQVYYSDSTPRFSGMTNNTLANIYYDTMTAGTGLRCAGVIDNPRYIVINQTNMPSLILEVAFMSNQGDLEKLLDDEFIEAIAQSICDATLEVIDRLDK